MAPRHTRRSSSTRRTARRTPHAARRAARLGGRRHGEHSRPIARARTDRFVQRRRIEVQEADAGRTTLDRRGRRGLCATKGAASGERAVGSDGDAHRRARGSTARAIVMIIHVMRSAVPCYPVPIAKRTEKGSERGRGACPGGRAWLVGVRRFVVTRHVERNRSWLRNGRIRGRMMCGCALPMPSSRRLRKKSPGKAVPRSRVERAGPEGRDAGM